MEINIDKTLNLISSTLQEWYELSIKNLPNLLVAILILVVFSFLAKTFKTLTLKISQKSGLTITVSELLSKTVFATVIFTGVFIALGVLQLDKTVTSLLAGAGVIGLALGFAFQEIASNFVSGVFIAIKQPYSVNDIVEVEGLKGKVKSIDLRTTSLMTFQGVEVFIPNKSMFTKALKNYTTTPVRRMDLTVGVSYSDNLNDAKSLAKKALEKVSNSVNGKDVEVFFTQFDSSSINFTGRVWINYKNEIDYFQARDEAIILIKESFDRHKITIPFPIRTLDLSTSTAKILDKGSAQFKANQEI